ncbi:hypothetical protein BJY24_005690 [Nocardia transvalensis]|uniref:Uncharacterized protein n=1 Tax=Nocardia transvalensis TaxID=37333 RepID=A0A7W9PJS8_9NOCA|nr:hypothetical protein [Nocardia transvalensis]MBB5916778.1 hypothetical protein [Nocardia transvalensis]
MTGFVVSDINGFVTYEVTLTRDEDGYGFVIETRDRRGVSYSPVAAGGFPTLTFAAAQSRMRLSSSAAPILLWPERYPQRHTPPPRDPATPRYAVTHTVTQIVDTTDPDRADALARQALADSPPLRWPIVSDTADIHELPDH